MSVVLEKRDPSEVDNAPAGKVRLFVDDEGQLSAKDETGAVVTPEAMIASLEALVATKQDASAAATDAELASAVAAFNTALNGKQDATTAATDSELANAVSTLNTAISAKQDASVAATDAELASAVVTLTAAIATKQDAATAATDAELAGAVATLTTSLAAKLDSAAVGSAGQVGKVLAADDPAVILNAKSYGAVGDGVADDTKALQAAIDAAVGGRLRIPPGHYKITASLLIPSKVVIEGDSDQTSVIVGTWKDATGEASKGWTYIRNADTSGAATDITVRNLGIEGPTEGAPSPSGGAGVATGLLMRRVKGVRIYNCRAYRIPGISIAYQGCQRVRIIGNEVNQGGRDGITGFWYTDNLTDVVVANNVIREVGDDGIAIGAAAENPNTVARPKNIVITGNTIYGATQAYTPQAGRGIIVTGIEDSVISNNTISDTFSTGIAVNLDSEGSLFRSRRVSVIGNTVRRAAVWNNATQPLVGIRLVGTDTCVVQGNAVSEAASDGIYVSDSTSASISGNAVEGCGTALGHFAIHLDGGSSTRNVFDCAVSGNAVRNNTGGIRCNFSQKCPIVGNTCVNNGRTGNGTQNFASGIIFTGDTTFIANANVCYDTAGAGSKTQTFGIVVTGTAPALVIEGNYLTGNAGVGLQTTGVTPAVLVKRGNVETTTPGSAVNFDQDPSGAKQLSGTGTPEGVVTAPVGSTFRRTDGGAGTVFYVKETGTGNTGWVAK